METTTLQMRQKEFGTYLMNGFPKLGLVGWSARGAAAACGNGTQENLCRPVTVGAKDHGSDGIMQWRLERLTNLKNFGVRNFSRWDTLEAQAAFLMWEMKSDYPKLSADLISGKYILEDLTADICWQFERPAKASANLPGRVKYAKDSLALLAPHSTPVPIAKSPQKTAVAVGVTTAVTGVTAAASSHALGAPSWVIIGLCLAGAATAIGFIVQHVSAKTAPLPPVNGAQP
jgi:hypothetical protein